MKELQGLTELINVSFAVMAFNFSDFRTIVRISKRGRIQSKGCCGSEVFLEK